MKVWHETSGQVINVPTASEQEQIRTNTGDVHRLLKPAEHTHTREHQDKVRAQLAEDLKAFLAAGGKITKVPRTI